MLQMKPARSKIEATTKITQPIASPDDDEPIETEDDGAEENVTKPETESSNFVVITNLRNKMSNLVQEIHLDMLTWGSLED